MKLLASFIAVTHGLFDQPQEVSCPGITKQAVPFREFDTFITPTWIDATTGTGSFPEVSPLYFTSSMHESICDHWRRQTAENRGLWSVPEGIKIDSRIAAPEWIGIRESSPGKFEVNYCCQSEIKEKTTLDCPFFDANGIHTEGTMRCQAGEQILVQSAIYGRSSSTDCSMGNGLYEAWRYEVCDASHDVTQTVKSKCDGEEACDYRGFGTIDTDPCVGIHKYVTIQYLCTEETYDPRLDLLTIRDQFIGEIEKTFGQYDRWAERVTSFFESKITQMMNDYDQKVSNGCAVASGMFNGIVDLPPNACDVTDRVVANASAWARQFNINTCSNKSDFADRLEKQLANLSDKIKRKGKC